MENSRRVICLSYDHLLQCNVQLGVDFLCREGNRLVIEHSDVKNDALSDLQNDELNALIGRFGYCFSEKLSELGRCKNTELAIELTSSVPINRCPYRIPFAKRETVTSIVNELFEYDIIRPSESSNASSIVLVKKQNGEDRMCIDYRKLNSVTVKRPYLMPIIDELMALLSSSRYFTTLDLMFGYYQIPVADDSRKYTEFVTNDSHFEYMCMPFGLVNAPAVFQTAMDKLRFMIPRGEVITYLDDVIIPSFDVRTGLEGLERFLKAVSTVGFTTRLSKCNFLAKDIIFLDHRINEDGISPGNDKVGTIENFPIPKNPHDVR